MSSRKNHILVCRGAIHGWTHAELIGGNLEVVSASTPSVCGPIAAAVERFKGLHGAEFSVSTRRLDQITAGLPHGKLAGLPDFGALIETDPDLVRQSLKAVLPDTYITVILSEGHEIERDRLVVITRPNRLMSAEAQLESGGLTDALRQATLANRIIQHFDDNTIKEMGRDYQRLELWVRPSWRAEV
jgi:hypothetical protein